MADGVRIKYPRRVFLRFFMRLLGRVLVSILTRTTVIGRENFPRSGPLIVVGNHVAIVEVMLMVLYTPWQIEVVGTGDIPIDPRFGWLARLWGFLPVRRGSVDREEMRLPVDVLKQNGIVGIFPEGGIWENSLRKARTGVAWLSYHADAPVLPIGFGGMRGALQEVLQFKRPRLTMNVGQVMPPVNVHVEGLSRKEALEQGANAIMARVSELIPPEEKRSWKAIEDERFDFKIVLQRPSVSTNGAVEESELTVQEAAALGKFFHRPVILDVMARNMRLPVRPLQQIGIEHDARRIADALDVAIGFLDENPQFLSYRFGYDEAGRMRAGVDELHALVTEAARNGDWVTLKPIRRYRRAGSDKEIVEVVPGIMHEM
jgi:1-acyl-sn-glycerol-3-phosphate acyltransferase